MNNNEKQPASATVREAAEEVVTMWHAMAGQSVTRRFDEGMNGTIKVLRAALDSEPVAEQMPGEWICDKCGFTLHKRILYTGNGAINADTSPLNEKCPNDGVLMRPLIWREANESIYKRCIEELEKNQKLSAEVERYRTALAKLKTWNDNGIVGGSLTKTLESLVPIVFELLALNGGKVGK